MTSPDIRSPNSGAMDTRPREGFSPTSPQADAGMRIEPPPSFPWAIGTMPDATAAAEPPLEPPVERSVFHGFLAGPYAVDSAVGRIPSSGVFVFPTTTKEKGYATGASPIRAAMAALRPLRR